jgi:hypothetical protein
MLEVHMVPVTNGESTLLRLRGGKEEVAILIDGGLSGQECVSYLKSLDITKLDTVVSSHFHWDHVGGLESVREDKDIEVGEYWTGDLRPFEDYCREPSSPYVLACLVTADGPLRSRNGKNRLVWDGVRKSFGGGRLVLEVLAPPYELWRRLRRPGVAAGLLQPGQESAYRRRLLGYPEPLDIEDEGDKPREPEGGWETAQPIGPEHLGEANRVTEDSLEEDKEPETARFLSSAISPWNDMSIVVKATFQSNVGPLSVLFPGDLANWSYVYAYHAADAKCDLLKIPHHCSDTYVDRKDVDNFVNGEWRFLAKGLESHGPDWLERQLRSRARSGDSLYYGWYRWCREFGYFPPFWAFPSIASITHASAMGLPTDIMDWLQPTEAFYFPLHHGQVRLPAWSKRERICSKVRQLYCTREPCARLKRTGLGVSCREHSRCKMRQQPMVFRWD